MGTDCVLIASNDDSITKEMIRYDIMSGSYPGGSGDFLPDRPYSLSDPVSAYNWIEVYPDYIVIHDGVRLRAAYDNDHFIHLIEYLQERCGSVNIWLIGDVSWVNIEDFRNTPVDKRGDKIL